MLLKFHTVKFNEEEEKSIKSSRVEISLEEALVEFLKQNDRKIKLFMTYIFIGEQRMNFFTIDMISMSIKNAVKVTNYAIKIALKNKSDVL